FIVLRNKTLNYVSDYNILDHYIDELAEIVLSRYSISMQVKITTLFLGEPNDETLNQIISDVYNGNPYIRGSKLFDLEEQIYNMLGINSLAVEKSSGVSDSEAKSNRAYTTSNANIYLDARNNGLKKLNKRYNLEIEALYNDEVLSEFSELAREEEKENGGDSSNGNDNNNDF